MSKKGFTMPTSEQLLNDAINAMSELHDRMAPDEDQMNAIIPPDAVRKFTDAHARLLYERERMCPSVI